MKPSVCLTMIVKDEARVIARCIEAARAVANIDAWVIVDTGSTDDTAAVAMAALAGIPGKYVEAQWEGFGKSRTRALEAAEGMADYAWIVDADDVWEGRLDRAQLVDDAHLMWFVRERDKFMTCRFLRLGRGWRYEGAVHEQPYRDAPFEAGPPLEGVTVTSPNDGASWADPEKYLKHAKLISQELVDDPTNPRRMYYLAQSYRDYGDFARAATLYQMRAVMGPGDCPEEVYCSLLYAGRCHMRLGNVPVAKALLTKAHAVHPQRREAMAELGRLYVIEAATSPTVGVLSVEYTPSLADEAAE